VTYICFIDCTAMTVPHLEVLEAESLDEAKIEAERLLKRHASGIAAHVYEGKKLLATVGKASERQDPERLLECGSESA